MSTDGSGNGRSYQLVLDPDAVEFVIALQRAIHERNFQLFYELSERIRTKGKQLEREAHLSRSMRVRDFSPRVFDPLTELAKLIGQTDPFAPRES